MGRLLLGTVIGGVVLFAWGFASWMFLDLHHLDVDPILPDEAAVVKALEGTERGVYWIPGGSQDTEMGSDEYKAWEEKHKKGPTGFLVYDPKGSDPMSTTVMAIGVGINLLTAFAVALLLQLAASRSFIKRFLMVFLVGVAVALVMDAQGWNWQGFPDDWVRGFVLDHLGGFAALGIVLAAIVRPRS